LTDDKLPKQKTTRPTQEDNNDWYNTLATNVAHVRYSDLCW